MLSSIYILVPIQVQVSFFSFRFFSFHIRLSLALPPNTNTHSHTLSVRISSGVYDTISLSLFGIAKKAIGATYPRGLIDLCGGRLGLLRLHQRNYHCCRFYRMMHNLTAGYLSVAAKERKREKKSTGIDEAYLENAIDSISGT